MGVDMVVAIKTAIAGSLIGSYGILMEGLLGFTM